MPDFGGLTIGHIVGPALAVLMGRRDCPDLSFLTERKGWAAEE
jgi:hypothetical protein